ncbi:MAG: DUF6968 family protein [Mycobacteriaceae bacterium]
MQSGDRTIQVVIGKPMPSEELAGDYSCPFTVTGFDDEPWSAFTGGTDGVQALVLALAMIGSRLQYEDKTTPLTFLGDTYLSFLTIAESTSNTDTYSVTWDCCRLR